MRALRVLTIVLIAAFGILSAANNPGKLYTSRHSGVWSMALGNCQLKVQTDGNNVVFIPLGNSGTQFLSSLTELVSSTKPKVIEVASTRGPYDVTEVLTVNYKVRDGEIVPSGYTLKRSYSRNGAVSTPLSSVCTDLAGDESI